MKKHTLQALWICAALLLPGGTAYADCHDKTEAKGCCGSCSCEENCTEEKEAAVSCGQDDADDGEGIILGMPNPWKETDSLEEACEGCGIDFSEPPMQAIPNAGQMVKGPYRYTDTMLELIYTGEDSELILRAAPDSLEKEETEETGESEGEEETGEPREPDDTALTGDYNIYSSEWEENFKGLAVHCRGDGDTINNAVFTSNGVQFAVLYNVGREGDGLTADELKSLVMGMQASLRTEQ